MYSAYAIPYLPEYCTNLFFLIHIYVLRSMMMHTIITSYLRTYLCDWCHYAIPSFAANCKYGYAATAAFICCSLPYANSFPGNVHWLYIYIYIYHIKYKIRKGFSSGASACSASCKQFVVQLWQDWLVKKYMIDFLHLQQTHTHIVYILSH